MANKLYMLVCLTDLHVVSGEQNNYAVDNEVQKDPVLECPTIFSSSLKGALRQHFESKKNGTDIIKILDNIGKIPGKAH